MATTTTATTATTTTSTAAMSPFAPERLPELLFHLHGGANVERFLSEFWIVPNEKYTADLVQRLRQLLLDNPGHMWGKVKLAQVLLARGDQQEADSLMAEATVIMLPPATINSPELFGQPHALIHCAERLLQFSGDDKYHNAHLAMKMLELASAPENMWRRMYPLALSWDEVAAAALHLLGRMHRDGIGCLRNPGRALICFTQAAMYCNGDAARALFYLCCRLGCVRTACFWGSQWFCTPLTERPILFDADCTADFQMNIAQATQATQATQVSDGGQLQQWRTQRLLTLPLAWTSDFPASVPTDTPTFRRLAAIHRDIHVAFDEITSEATRDHGLELLGATLLTPGTIHEVVVPIPVDKSLSDALQLLHTALRAAPVGNGALLVQHLFPVGADGMKMPAERLQGIDQVLRRCGGDLTAEQKAQLHYFKLRCHGELGHWQLAAECGEKSLELNAADYYALYGLGVAYTNLGNSAQAKRRLEEYHTKAPADHEIRPNVCYLRAMLAHSDNQVGEAREFAELGLFYESKRIPLLAPLRSLFARNAAWIALYRPSRHPTSHLESTTELATATLPPVSWRVWIKTLRKLSAGKDLHQAIDWYRHRRQKGERPADFSASMIEIWLRLAARCHSEHRIADLLMFAEALAESNFVLSLPPMQKQQITAKGMAMRLAVLRGRPEFAIHHAEQTEYFWACDRTGFACYCLESGIPPDPRYPVADQDPTNPAAWMNELLLVQSCGDRNTSGADPALLISPLEQLLATYKNNPFHPRHMPVPVPFTYTPWVLIHEYLGGLYLAVKGGDPIANINHALHYHREMLRGCPTNRYPYANACAHLAVANDYLRCLDGDRDRKKAYRCAMLHQQAAIDSLPAGAFRMRRAVALYERAAIRRRALQEGFYDSDAQRFDWVRQIVHELQAAQRTVDAVAFPELALSIERTCAITLPNALPPRVTSLAGVPSARNSDTWRASILLDQAVDLQESDAPNALRLVTEADDIARRLGSDTLQWRSVCLLALQRQRCNKALDQPLLDRLECAVFSSTQFGGEGLDAKQHLLSSIQWDLACNLLIGIRCEQRNALAAIATAELALAMNHSSPQRRQDGHALLAALEDSAAVAVCAATRRGVFWILCKPRDQHQVIQLTVSTTELLNRLPVLAEHKNVEEDVQGVGTHVRPLRVFPGPNWDVEKAGAFGRLLELNRVSAALGRGVQRLHLLPLGRLRNIPWAALWCCHDEQEHGPWATAFARGISVGFSAAQALSATPALTLGAAQLWTGIASGESIGPELPPLPYAVREIELSKQLMAGTTSAERWCDATPSSVCLRTDVGERIRRSQIVHFACHGGFKHQRLGNEHRAVLLLPSPRKPNSGVIYCDEIELSAATIAAKLRLQPGCLVLLSACSSGYHHNPDNDHDSMQMPTRLHLPSAFLAAGAAHVVAPLWPVDDLASTVVMLLFYSQLLLDANATPAAALQRAQRIAATATTAELCHRLPPGLRDDLDARFAADEVPFADFSLWAAMTVFG